MIVMILMRLGCAGVVRRVVVDTSYFTGNYPPEVVVEAVVEVETVAGEPA